MQSAAPGSSSMLSQGTTTFHISFEHRSCLSFEYFQVGIVAITKMWPILRLGHYSIAMQRILLWFHVCCVRGELRGNDLAQAKRDTCMQFRYRMLTRRDFPDFIWCRLSNEYKVLWIHLAWPSNFRSASASAYVNENYIFYHLSVASGTDRHALSEPHTVALNYLFFLVS